MRTILEIAVSLFAPGGSAALFGSIGIAAVLVWPRLRSYQGAVAVQCAGAAAFAAYFGVGGSSTASASCILAAIQLITVGLTRDRRVVMLVFTATLACLALMATWIWTGVPTVLATCGCLLSTLARMQPTTHRMKLWFLFAAPFWLAHNILTTSLLALAVDAMSIFSNGASLMMVRANFTVRVAGPVVFARQLQRVSGEFWQAARICVS